MKQFLKKPLGLAVAATLAIGGMTAFTSAAAAINANALGDLALVPYYTVRGDFVTGVHITNTSDMTQVVKVRLRRGSDSADALDFNVILSPFDMWTGTVTDSGGALGIATGDQSCTAPIANGSDASGKPKFIAPATFAANNAADEGYLEIIGMGAADAMQPISVGALHSGGVPADCAAVRGNFLAANVSTNAQTTSGSGTTAAARGTSNFTDTEDVLKVSFFIRDSVTGMEMGDNAQHIASFAADPMMTNQQFGLNSGDTAGFDFPDLDGGGANGGNGATRGGTTGLYDTVIRADLGSASILNDWSYNTANGVSTDWVVTIPGQYLMDDPADNGMLVINGMGDTTNHRDLPVLAGLSVYDREETKDADTGGLVISPSPVAESTSLTREVNVIEWGGQSVFGTANAITVTPGLAARSGWAELVVTPAATGQTIYDLTNIATGATSAAPANTRTPMIGFTGWQRTFSDASKNYGRMVSHSRK